jgi:hypothetical protein
MQTCNDHTIRGLSLGGDILFELNLVRIIIIQEQLQYRPHSLGSGCL